MTVTVASRGPTRLRSVITVHEGSPTGAIVNQRLLGALHPFGGLSGALTEAAPAKAHAAGVINVQRSDKHLVCTPIKAGAPDATHPTLGYSGTHSYDWQVVDRGMADVASQGAQLYPSLDSCPQILGGSVAPFSGVQLATWLPGHSSYAPQVPNDLETFGAMCVDLLHHIIVELGYVIPYASVGNEPDGGAQFWIGTDEQYYDYFAAIANAVKAYDPTIKIGGPELVSITVAAFDTWVKGLMSYCMTNDVALDFIATHDYAARGWDLQMFMSYLERAKTDLGWTDPLEVLNGEWNACHGANNPTGSSPWGVGSGENLSINDSHAAAVMHELMEMQRLGFERGIIFAPDSAADTTGISGLFSNTGPTAIGNDYRLWARLGAAEIVESEIDADPGMTKMAARGEDGTLFVLLANNHYRRGIPRFPVTIALPDTANGRETMLWMIDRDHSNQFDAGLAHAELETVPAADVAANQVRLTLPARCACLLEIAP